MLPSIIKCSYASYTNLCTLHYQLKCIQLKDGLERNFRRTLSMNKVFVPGWLQITNFDVSRCIEISKTVPDGVPTEKI